MYELEWRINRALWYVLLNKYVACAVGDEECNAKGKRKAKGNDSYSDAQSHCAQSHCP